MVQAEIEREMAASTERENAEREMALDGCAALPAPAHSPAPGATPATGASDAPLAAFDEPVSPC
jgi:hypothetical protein